MEKLREVGPFHQKIDRDTGCSEVALESLTGVDRSIWKKKLGNFLKGSYAPEIWKVLKEELNCDIFEGLSTKRVINYNQFQELFAIDPKHHYNRITLTQFKRRGNTPGLYYIGMVKHAFALEIDQEGVWWSVDAGNPQRFPLDLRNGDMAKSMRGPYLGPRRQVKYYARLPRGA